MVDFTFEDLRDHCVYPRQGERFYIYWNFKRETYDCYLVQRGIRAWLEASQALLVLSKGREIVSEDLRRACHYQRTLGPRHKLPGQQRPRPAGRGSVLTRRAFSCRSS